MRRSREALGVQALPAWTLPETDWLEERRGQARQGEQEQLNLQRTAAVSLEALQQVWLRSFEIQPKKKDEYEYGSKSYLRLTLAAIFNRELAQRF